jgi:hypothetical protein
MQGGSDASLFFGHGVREHTEILKMDFRLWGPILKKMLK